MCKASCGTEEGERGTFRAEMQSDDQRQGSENCTVFNCIVGDKFG